MEANRLDQTRCPHCGLTSANSLWDEETSKHFDAPLLPISSAKREGEAAFICPNCQCESDGVTNYDEMLQQTDKGELIRQQQAEIERLNRAYEVLQKAAVYYSEAELYEPNHLGGFSVMEADAGKLAREAISEAQRIKDGKDGEQG